MKCEACGYDNVRPYNPIRRMIKLMDERKTSCKTTLRDICKLIHKQIPSDKDNQKTYYFLQAISKVPDTSVQHYVSRYEEGEYVYQGKGFAYLKKMIIDGYGNEPKMLENEIRKFGRTPAKKKVERGEYKNVYTNNGGDSISS